ncbi:hypothetical protein BN140_3067 [Methanoculleus bourgensis MS2]|uniref:Uncharacterized protein n=1 Tax=Methanoculleus bourgensis (strain ATCC 43281 / DSM 3045 / OCM 15 / MS2) TaxID=1201294 RepID=W6PR05_METBM|nr:hypothetical protein BN140_3067 [Methanoculleus bourgensis MS2]
MRHSIAFRAGASMEPCLFRHGKPYLDIRIYRGYRASMEPCLFRHGKLELAHEDGPVRPASMEPCLFRHGKIVWDRVVHGVGDLLQWSHVFSDMVRGQRNGPGRMRISCFNGAMSFQTW